MKLTRERALELHRQMWTDMQKELGDCPRHEDRCKFKKDWCTNVFGRDLIGTVLVHNDCFLCEYVKQVIKEPYVYWHCDGKCPIKWSADKCEDSEIDEENWGHMPISKLLALPEREDE